MTKKEIEKLSRVAVEVAKAHDMGGVCGFHPGYNYCNDTHVPRVHLHSDVFCKTFDKAERGPYTEKYDEMFVTIDGVKFFSLLEKEVK